MKIADLKNQSNFDELKVRILSKQGPREINKGGRILYVWNVLVIDEESSTIILSLWGRDAGDKYKVGQVVSITNGWCSEFQDKKQISLGREGKMFPADNDPNIPTSVPG